MSWWSEENQLPQNQYLAFRFSLIISAWLNKLYQKATKLIFDFHTCWRRFDMDVTKQIVIITGALKGLFNVPFKWLQSSEKHAN